MPPTVLAEADEIAPQVVADRRYLHENPELSFKEYETAKFVAGRLEALGLEVRTGVGSGTGVVGLLRGGKPGKTVLLRADMDALPIDEQNDVPYKSTVRGVMHACGHDGHTAMLLGAARLLTGKREEIAGNVKFIFQPAEELPPGGAKPMIEDGVLENPKVDAAFGLHMAQDFPAGTIAIADGPSNAAADIFDATITGRGGHAARPHKLIDPVVIACQAVSALQLLVSRELDPLKPAVITVGSITGGTVHNVIPSEATIKGTVRTFDADVQDMLEERLEAVIKGVAATFRAEATVNYTRGYPSMINNAEMVALARGVAAEIVGEENVKVRNPGMGGEDMAYFLRAVPGCFVNIGSNNEERGLTFGHHHARFDIDEVSLPIGVAVLTTLALEFLDS